MDRLDPRVNAIRADLADITLLGKVDSPNFIAGETMQVAVAHAPLRQGPTGGASLLTEALLGERADTLDRFDRIQLEEVVRACAKAKSLSQAGRELFAMSRQQRASTNDADRLRKYLAKFGLDWEQVRGTQA